MAKPPDFDDIKINAFNRREDTIYQYQATDIKLIQNVIMKDYVTKFVIHQPIGNGESIDVVYTKLFSTLDKNKPILCVYNWNNLHWVVFAALTDGKKITILYKDSEGGENSGLPKMANCTVVKNSGKEQTSGLDCGIFALENMRIMAEQLHKDRQNFIEVFKNFKGFCSLKKAKELRETDFAEKFVLGTYYDAKERFEETEIRPAIREHHVSELTNIETALKRREKEKDEKKGNPDKSKAKKYKITTHKEVTDEIVKTKDLIKLEIGIESFDGNPQDYNYFYKIYWRNNFDPSGYIKEKLEELKLKITEHIKDTPPFVSLKVQPFEEISCGRKKVTDIKIPEYSVSLKGLCDDLYTKKVDETYIKGILKSFKIVYEDDLESSEESSGESGASSDTSEGNSSLSSASSDKGSNTHSEDSSSSNIFSSQPIALLKELFKTEGTGNSNLLASDSEPAPSQLQGVLKIIKTDQEGLKASYLLAALGTDLLRLDVIKEGSQKLRDPLEFKIEFLKKQEFEKTLALDFIRDVESRQLSKDYRNNTDLQRLKEEYTNLIKSSHQELEKVRGLQKTKESLHDDFAGLFPYIPRKFTATFIEKYNENKTVPSQEEGIRKELKDIRQKLEPDGLIENTCHILDIKVTKTKKSNKISKSTKTELVERIDNLVGQTLTVAELQKIKYKIKNTKLESCETQGGIDKEVKNLTSNKKVQEIHEHLSKSYQYTIDPDYLKSIAELSTNEKCNFLVQVRLYKKLGRDMAKNVLLLSSGGMEDLTVSLPPGINTTIKITAGGTMSYHLGELSSYKNIALLNLQTLKSYPKFLTQEPKIREEKENEFKFLHQIEVIRNCSALLTNAMFFELSAANFQPMRLIGKRQLEEAELLLQKAKDSGKKKEKAIEAAKEKLSAIRNIQDKPVEKYGFSKVADQMPMAMKGAVSGSVYLEQKFLKLGLKCLIYDYRAEGDEKIGKVLAIRDNNILFDWLCHTLIAREKLPLSFDINPNKQFPKDGWNLEKNDNYKHTLTKNSYKIVICTVLGEEIASNIAQKLQANFRKEKNKNLVNLSQDHLTSSYQIHNGSSSQTFEIKEGDNLEKVAEFKATWNVTSNRKEIKDIKYFKYAVSKIEKFPLNVFNELVENWYGIEGFIGSKKIAEFPLEGQGLFNQGSEVYWYRYSKTGMQELLGFRLESAELAKVKVIIPDDFWNESTFTAERLASDISPNLMSGDKILVVLNLYAKHWVGLGIDKTTDGQLNISYMDPEQNEIPILLKETLIKQLASAYPEYQVQLRESELEPQKYNNCGPEVIENFIQYLTGDRLRQEDAVAVHSALLENSLLLGEGNHDQYNA